MTLVCINCTCETIPAIVRSRSQGAMSKTEFFFLIADILISLNVRGLGILMVMIHEDVGNRCHV